MSVKVTAQCVMCKHEADFGSGEVPRDQTPMCSKCGSPMVAVRAANQEER